MPSHSPFTRSTLATAIGCLIYCGVVAAVPGGVVELPGIAELSVAGLDGEVDFLLCFLCVVAAMLSDELVDGIDIVSVGVDPTEPALGAGLVADGELVICALAAVPISAAAAKAIMVFIANTPEF